MFRYSLDPKKRFWELIYSKGYRRACWFLFRVPFTGKCVQCFVEQSLILRCGRIEESSSLLTKSKTDVSKMLDRNNLVSIATTELKQLIWQEHQEYFYRIYYFFPLTFFRANDSNLLLRLLKHCNFAIIKPQTAECVIYMSLFIDNRWIGLTRRGCYWILHETLRKTRSNKFGHRMEILS